MALYRACLLRLCLDVGRLCHGLKFGICVMKSFLEVVLSYDTTSG